MIQSPGRVTLTHYGSVLVLFAFAQIAAAVDTVDRFAATNADSEAQTGAQVQVVEGDVLTWASSGRRSLVSRGASRLWVDGIVPYTIHPDLPENSVQAINEAIEHWNEVSGVTLIPLEQLPAQSGDSSSNPDSVIFIAGDGCASWIGRRGGQQEIWVARNCTKGTMLHEIGHALGLEHEHTRPDRDQHIVVNWENISEGKSHNFNIATGSSRVVGEYDYRSIMHYGPYNFSRDGSPTIRPIAGSMELIGQRAAPSAGDLAAVESLYSVDLSITAHLYPIKLGAEAAIYVSNNDGRGANTIQVTAHVDYSRLLSYSDNGWYCKRGDDGNTLCELDRLSANASSLLLLHLTADDDQEEESMFAELRSKTPDANPHNNADESSSDRVPVMADAVYEEGYRLGGSVGWSLMLLALLLCYRQAGFRVQFKASGRVIRFWCRLIHA